MNEVQQIMDAYFHRAMQEALARYGAMVPGKGLRIVASIAELRATYADICGEGVPVRISKGRDAAQ